jgi:hypothetical protein
LPRLCVLRECLVRNQQVRDAHIPDWLSERVREFLSAVGCSPEGRTEYRTLMYAIDKMEIGHCTAYWFDNWGSIRQDGAEVLVSRPGQLSGEGLDALKYFCGNLRLDYKISDPEGRGLMIVMTPSNRPRLELPEGVIMSFEELCRRVDEYERQYASVEES